jgi:type III pantothenate kinase
MTTPDAAFIAVDIGNSRTKFGLFAAESFAGAANSAPPRSPAAAPALPVPTRTFDFDPRSDAFESVANWLLPQSPAELTWWIGSVERNVASQLVEWLRSRGVEHIMLLRSGDLPLTVSLPRPDMVGIDRLLAALAANQLRPANVPAIVVDLGTAVTVDLVSREGAFMGGAILPGIGLAARALHEFTDLLPLLDMTSLAEPPAALGADTISAMRSGLYWGAIGGARHLVGLLSAEPAAVYLTGGAAAAVAGLIAPAAQYVGHLTLSGIALAAGRASP